MMFYWFFTVKKASFAGRAKRAFANGVQNYKKIFFNTFYVLSFFIRDEIFNICGREWRIHSLPQSVPIRYNQYFHSFVTLTVNVWNGNSSPSLGNVS